MNIKIIAFTVAAIVGTVQSRAQGTVFVYDQQSSTESNVQEGYLGIQSYQLAQSFTPSLNAVGFVRMDLLANGPATLDVVLHANSLTGPVIGTSEQVTLQSGFAGFVNFYFDTPASVTPGTMYYFQPVVLPGGSDVATYTSRFYNYTGGAAFYQGTASSTDDLWFREGIIVPEPSTWALLLMCAGALWFLRRKL